MAEEKKPGAVTRRDFLKGIAVGAVAAAAVSAGVVAVSWPPAVAPPPAKVYEKDIVLTINGDNYALHVKNNWTLMEVIKERLGFWGVKNGCARGECGACTVLIDGKPVQSCMMLAVEAEGKKIETLEGIFTDVKLHPIQEAFVKYDAMQCGFCTPGMIMTAKALLDTNPSPTRLQVKEALSGNLCRCGAYPKIIEAVLSLNMSYPVPPITWPKELTFVGKKDAIRVLAPRMVAGKWDYASDIVLPEMLYARVLGSPYAHAKITSIDTSKAEALPGVKAIATYKDQPTLFPQEVTWWGCQVAAVAATDVHIAEEALSLIDVKYEVLPFVLDADEARKPGAIETGVVPKNVLGPIEVKRGDWTKGFAEADIIIEDTAGWTGVFHHQHAEARACVAKWDGDYLTIWCGSQNPFGNRASVAAALTWPLNKIRIISHGTGTGFGDKHRLEQNAIAALLAKKGGHPVKLVADGFERVTMGTRQYECKIDTLKIGAKKDGMFTAIEMMMYADIMGRGTPYGTGTPTQRASDAYSPMQLTYTCPNAHFVGYSIATNKPPSGYWRCVGEPPGTFLMDIVIDELAEKLGMDPVELRLKNCFKGKIGELKDQDTGLLLSSMAMDECFTKAADAIGWKTKWHAPGTKTLPDGRLHGISISGLVSNKGGLATGSGTIILMTTDGKAQLQTGLSSANGGSTTTVALIAAEVLGLASMDDITLFDPGDTATTQDSGMEGGSTRTITAGAGAYMAALDAKDQLFEIAAPMLGVKPEELEAKGGKIYVKADPTKALTHKEVCTAAYMVRGTNLIGRGYQWFAPKHTVRTECVEIAEVAVDPETGAVEVLSMVCADDLGRAVHWKGSENQCEGSMIMCIALANMDDDQILDKATGATLNPNLLDQRYCTILDYPDDLKVILVEPIDVVGPFGCKGLGEPPVAPGHGAIINAIYNATGKWIKTHPATESVMLKALGKA